jgi:hypothetical protein
VSDIKSMIMDEILALLAGTTLEDTNGQLARFVEYNLEYLFADCAFDRIVCLQKVFDHYLFFCTICETSPRHMPASERILV